ncbi:hypothetical protein HDU90_004082 [Geranomyces variabilis]|nr:hypothetical protein HDU90_004082 [Geranomyces variabilis]
MTPSTIQVRFGGSIPLTSSMMRYATARFSEPAHIQWKINSGDVFSYYGSFTKSGPPFRKWDNLGRMTSIKDGFHLRAPGTACLNKVTLTATPAFIYRRACRYSTAWYVSFVGAYYWDDFLPIGLPKVNDLWGGYAVTANIIVQQNMPPSVSVPALIGGGMNEMIQLTSNVVSATDVETSVDGLVWTLVSITPAGSGNLSFCRQNSTSNVINSVTIGAGGTFLQSDIVVGAVYFTPGANVVGTPIISLTLSDGLMGAPVAISNVTSTLLAQRLVNNMSAWQTLATNEVFSYAEVSANQIRISLAPGFVDWQNGAFMVFVPPTGSWGTTSLDVRISDGVQSVSASVGIVANAVPRFFYPTYSITLTRATVSVISYNLDAYDRNHDTLRYFLASNSAMTPFGCLQRRNADRSYTCVSEWTNDDILYLRYASLTRKLGVDNITIKIAGPYDIAPSTGALASSVPVSRSQSAETLTPTGDRDDTTSRPTTQIARPNTRTPTPSSYTSAGPVSATSSSTTTAAETPQTSNPTPASASDTTVSNDPAVTKSSAVPLTLLSGAVAGGVGGAAVLGAGAYMFFAKQRAAAALRQAAVTGGTAGNILIKDRLPPKKSGRSLFSISAFRDVRFSAFSFCFILSKAGAFTPFAYIQDYALANGVDPKFAAYIMPIMNAAAIPGRIAPGHLGDKFGVFNLIFPSALFGGLCSLAIWLPAKDGPTLMAYTAAYGFFNGQYRKTCVNCGFVAGSKVLRGFGGNGSGRR